MCDITLILTHSENASILTSVCCLPSQSHRHHSLNFSSKSALEVDDKNCKEDNFKDEYGKGKDEEVEALIYICMYYVVENKNTMTEFNYEFFVQISWEAAIGSTFSS